jgi:hypothetical protein
LTVVRLALLLDRDPTVVSFQHIYNCLKRPDVVDLLVYRTCHASELAEALDDRIADDVRTSTSSKPTQLSIGMISTVASNIFEIAASCTLPPNRS